MDHKELDLVLIKLRQILEKNDLNQAVKIIENLLPADQADIVAEPPESKISSIMETKLTTVFNTTDQEECDQTLSDIVI